MIYCYFFTPRPANYSTIMSVVFCHKRWKTHGLEVEVGVGELPRNVSSCVSQGTFLYFGSPGSDIQSQF